MDDGARMKSSEARLLKLEHLLESMQDLVFEVAKDGTVIGFYQPQNANLYTPPEVFLNKHYRESLPPDVVEQLDLAMDIAREGLESVDFDYSLKIKEKVYWYNARFSLIAPKGDGDEHYLIVSRDITRRKNAELAKERLLILLEESLERVQVLQGFLPVCSSCKNIRDSVGVWHPMEAYIERHSGASFTHSICPSCASIYCPGWDRE